MSTLNTVRFSDLFQWDIKRLAQTGFYSHMPVVPLGNYIIEQSQKYDISNPNQQYGILGVNNKTGIFDAYIEKGSNIHQKYKRMEDGWIAYNPYRVNVGSIGMKKPEHKNQFISPAYIVFSCTADLLPEYLYLLMKTSSFNKIIRNNTTGSVRQNLSFSVLKNLQIPLPSIQLQNEIVTKYNYSFYLAKDIEQKTKELENQIQQFLQKEIGISQQKKQKQNERLFFSTVNFKQIKEWGVGMLCKTQNSLFTKYPSKRTFEICSVSSGGTPSRTNPSYYQGNIPWVKTGEVINDVIYSTEENISEEAIANSSAKLFPKDSLIIAMYGQGDTRGRTAKLGIEATTNQACAVLFDVNQSIVLIDYLWYYFQACYHDLRSLASGNNQPNLNIKKISNYQVVLPSLEVQKQIIDYVFQMKEQIKSLKQQATDLRDKALTDFEKELF